MPTTERGTVLMVLRPTFSILYVLEYSNILNFTHKLMCSHPTNVTTIMPSITTNNKDNTAATYDSNDNSHSNNTCKMNSHSIKINFKGASRDVDLPTPATLSGLQAAVASTFKVELAARSEAGGADSDLSFTYKDSDGDDIVFDKDSELSLALRLCPSPLEISAASKPKDKVDAKPDEGKIYRRAARNLREYNGVPSMTPPKLIQTLAFLKLHPRRLVKQGLAPAHLLAGVQAPEPLGSDNNDDLAEVVASDMELMSVEDDRKEWNDGFVSVGDGEMPNEADTAAVAGHSSSSSEDEEGVGDGAGAGKKGEPKPKNVMHGAFLAAGIRLRPREVMPLLLALGVRPRRLVKLGHVDGKELRAVLESMKRRRHHHHGGGHPKMAHPGLAHPRARVGGPGGPIYCVGGPRGHGGKPCGPGRRVGRGSPVEGVFLCHPPPPPPHAGGGGPGGFCGPHHHGHPGHPGPPGHPGHYGGTGGCGGSPEMTWMDARSARRAGGGRHGCGGRGGADGGGHWYGYWG